MHELGNGDASIRCNAPGEDFVIDVDDKPARLGFFTTRWVRARTPEDAELAAVALVKSDRTLVARVHRAAAVTPTLYAESVERRPWWQGFKTGGGYAFWDMDGEPSPSNNCLEGDAYKATRASG